MTGGGVLGGGVIFVVAALLWVAVLVPAWMRRREFRAAERNALRLQRTLRVLAETSEVPQEMHIEATAKEALAHEKLLRTAQRRQEAERDADLAEARAEQVRAEIRAQQMKRKQAAAQRSAKLRRPMVRRVRALAALGAMVGVIGALVGGGLAIAGSGLAVLAWSGLLFAAGLGALVLLAPGRISVPSIPAETVAARQAEAVAAADESDVVVATGETAETMAAHAAAQRAAADRIKRARAMARAREGRPAARENQTDSILLREAREQVMRARGVGESAVADGGEGASPEARVDGVTAAAERQTVQARESALKSQRAAEARAARAAAAEAAERETQARLRRMGVVGDTAQGMPDLDAALRRRRNIG